MARKTKKDLRSPLAKDRDDWLESQEGAQCCRGITQGEFLRNRLVLAFLAGVKWGQKHPED